MQNNISFLAVMVLIYSGYVAFFTAPKNIERAKEMASEKFIGQYRSQLSEVKMRMLSKCTSDFILESNLSDKNEFYTRAYLDSFQVSHEIQSRLSGILTDSIKRDNPSSQDLKDAEKLMEQLKNCWSGIS